MAKKKNYRLCCLIANKRLSRIGKAVQSGDVGRLDKALSKLKKDLKKVR